MPLEGLEPVAGGSAPPLPPGVTRVWTLELDVGPTLLEALWTLLSPDEIVRAERIRERRQRARFVAGRAQLRQLIGECLRRPPESFRFAYSPAGKPSLNGDPEVARLQFNAAGCEALGLVAMRSGAEIGVDAERVRPMQDLPAFAGRLLGAAEHEEFEKVPSRLREARFFEYWVRKEAAAKTLGSGLRAGLDQIRIHPWRGDGSCQVEWVAQGARRCTWVIGISVPVAGYVAALAATQPIGPVFTGCWEPRLPH
jgi:4'-phosphopantetheinyl transferase